MQIIWDQKPFLSTLIASKWLWHPGTLVLSLRTRNQWLSTTKSAVLVSFRLYLVYGILAHPDADIGMKLGPSLRLPNASSSLIFHFLLPTQHSTLISSFSSVQFFSFLIRPAFGFPMNFVLSSYLNFSIFKITSLSYLYLKALLSLLCHFDRSLFFIVCFLPLLLLLLPHPRLRLLFSYFYIYLSSYIFLPLLYSKVL